MRVLILDSKSEVEKTVAACIADRVMRQPDCVLGLATGSSLVPVYAHLVSQAKAAKLSFADVKTFNLDEYLGLTPDHPLSFAAYMREQLFSHLDFNEEYTRLPSCLHARDAESVANRYETSIRAIGGIDLQLLGIGENGHIGFNEPYSSLSSRTRVKTLCEATLQRNSALENTDRLPSAALTVGIGTILDAREIVVIACGENKASAIAAAIQGPVRARCPASVLQLHQRVTYVLDPDAASQLDDAEYFYEVMRNELSLRSDYPVPGPLRTSTDTRLKTDGGRF
ncbi:MAG: glucosamine-6-phosphate deaminase [Pseudomonadota bacterium]